MSRGKALTITYLVKTTLASLNGSDKEADNISSIKKITKEQSSIHMDLPSGLEGHFVISLVC